jgi:hypothetical protein
MTSSAGGRPERTVRGVAGESGADGASRGCRGEASEAGGPPGPRPPPARSSGSDVRLVSWWWASASAPGRRRRRSATLRLPRRCRAWRPGLRARSLTQGRRRFSAAPTLAEQGSVSHPPAGDGDPARGRLGAPGRTLPASGCGWPGRSRSRRGCVGRSLLSVLRKARSTQIHAGRGLCRRGAESISCVNRKTAASDHAGRGAGCGYGRGKLRKC